MAREIRFCPNCGSTDVEPDTSNAGRIAVSGGNSNIWKCNNCEYTGMMPEGDPEKDFDQTEESIEFEPEEEYPREDTGFGRGYLKYLLYIAVPFAVIYILLQI